MNGMQKAQQNIEAFIAWTATQSDEDYKKIIFRGQLIVLTQAVQESMELGYCITLHKAQGSQFLRVIIALRPGRIVDRAWLYTAITRAESEVHIVGTARDLATITQNPSFSH